MLGLLGRVGAVVVLLGSLVASRPAEGTVVYEREATEAAGVQEPGAVVARAACADTAYSTAGHKEYGTYLWHVGDGAMPGGLSRDAARKVFEEAISTITGERNDCGIGGGGGPRARFLSATGREAGIDREGRCSSRDGVSVWDAGELPEDVVAVTCSWAVTMPDGGANDLIEADVRFNTRHHRFTDAPGVRCADAYDVRAVGTHEAGHVFGLGHVGVGHENLTMYTNSFACSSRARTLGRGDVLGLRSLYR
ncbi:matrixin family metalloprotease [Streptomyces acidiscabies]|nr:matrixin family metalloprotease [Streptomyces acidiscabies]